MISPTCKSAGLGTNVNQNSHFFCFCFFEIHLSCKASKWFLAMQGRAPLGKSSGSDDQGHILEAVESL